MTFRSEMRYLSVCSGIEAATVAWQHMGWEAAGFSEIEPFPCAVLRHHYHDVPNLGDMTRYREWDCGTVDLLVGGTPCQSFSVAGLRKGLDDPRGNLALVYCGILDHFRPRWFVWENVPGVLSSNGGRDFGSFLGAVAELGYGFAYRVLDAQWFGVAQRRRRVFVVGCLGDWRRAAAVLFERESLCRDFAPSREKRQDVAPTVTQGPPFSRTGNQRVETDAIITMAHGQGGAEIRTDGGVPTLTCVHEAPIAAYSIQGNLIGRDAGGPQGVGVSGDGVMYTLTKADVHGVAQPIPLDLRNAGRDPEKHDAMNRQGVGVGDPGDPAHTVTTACVHGVANGMAVRRLTPVECERLQGFPDNYTNIKDNCPDGPRYKALGNSMAVPVMRWIGERING